MFPHLIQHSPGQRYHILVEQFSQNTLPESKIFLRNVPYDKWPDSWSSDTSFRYPMRMSIVYFLETPGLPLPRCRNDLYDDHQPASFSFMELYPGGNILQAITVVHL